MTTFEELRVITLNLWHSDTSPRARLEAAAKTIKEQKPHVVLLQEVRFDDTFKAEGHDNSASMLAELSSMTVVQSAVMFSLKENVGSGLAILTSLEVVSSRSESLRAGGGCCGQSGLVSLAWLKAPSGRPLLVLNTHLPWGGAEEPHRLKQATMIDRVAQREVFHQAHERTPIVILGGDFNAAPTSDTVRFLTGEGVGAGVGTLWLDSWSVAGEGSGDTSSPLNFWAKEMASSNKCLDPSRLPSRRIDFVMVYGWVYGKPGQPLRSEIAFDKPQQIGDQELTASDHFGVCSAFWDPPLDFKG